MKNKPLELLKLQVRCQVLTEQYKSLGATIEELRAKIEVLECEIESDKCEHYFNEYGCIKCGLEPRIGDRVHIESIERYIGKNKSIETAKFIGEDKQLMGCNACGAQFESVFYMQHKLYDCKYKKESLINEQLNEAKKHDPACIVNQLHRHRHIITENFGAAWCAVHNEWHSYKDFVMAEEYGF